jgi:hypothetical protein
MSPMRIRLIALLLSLPGLAPAQPAPDAVVIDGKLRDAFWDRIHPEKLAPVEAGVPAAAG